MSSQQFVHELPWYSMWSSTEEEGFPLTVIKLHGCLENQNEKRSIYVMYKMHIFHSITFLNFSGAPHSKQSD